MHRLGAKALVWSGLALLTAGAVGGTGCTAKKPTELVPGVSSQMVVPKDLSGVSIEVVANGRQVFCQGYLVSPETHVIDLPSTLGVIPAQSPDTVVKITVRGYDATGITKDDFSNCGGAAIGGGGTTNSPRILRRSIQTYVDSHILFLPMPLSYSCIDKDCSATGADATCKGNVCVDSKTDQTTLPDFDPTLLDGTGLCFSPSMCFPKGLTFPAAVVDKDQCIYSLPSYDVGSQITSGLNVKVFYQDWIWEQNPGLKGKPYEQIVTNAGEEEILNEDPINCGEPVPAGQKANPTCEGFKVLPSSGDAGVGSEATTSDALASLPTDGGFAASLPYNPTALRIQLAPGLCDLVHAGQTPPAAPTTGTLSYHSISDISVSGLCPPKLPLLPICAMERNNNPVLADAGTTGDGVCNVALPLSPAPSILYLVMDDTTVMHGALGPSGSVTGLALSFTDPVFKRTYAGFKYFSYDDQPASCSAPSTPYTVPDVPACTPGTGNCAFNLINSIQPQVATALEQWTQATPIKEWAQAPDGGSIVCYSDPDCLSMGVGTYCSKPNEVIPEGGLPEAGAFDAGDDGGDGGTFTPGVCTNPQSLDLANAMRLDVGAYAQVLGVAATLPPAGVAGVMFFVNRVPETQLGPPGFPTDGGAPEAGAGDGGTAPAAYPAPVGALDCPSLPQGSGALGATPGDVGQLPNEAVAAQQILESEALNAFNNPGQALQTYFVLLDNDRHDVAEEVQFFTQMQTDLQQPNGVQPVVTLDATNLSKSALGDPTKIDRAKNELQDFTSIIGKLGTCLYELPQSIPATTPPSGVTIQYNKFLPPGMNVPPGTIPPVKVPYDSTCNAVAAAQGDAGTANGWSFDTGRVRICGGACDALRAEVQKASTYGFATGVNTDVPVLITPLCTGSSGSSGASGGGDATVVAPDGG